jgi:cell division protein FtsQ
MARPGRTREKQKIRRNKKRRREGWLESWGPRFGRGILGAATLASLAFLGYMIYQYVQRVPLLNVGEIRILGCLNATEAELLSLAKIDFKDSLVHLNLQDLSSRLAQHPWVENARVQRDWSRKALIIEVKERVPQALILFDDLYLVDQQGEVFKKADAKERMDLPVLTGLSQKEVTQKDPQALRLIRQSLDLLEHLRQRKVFNAKRVSEIYVSRQNGITLFTTDGAMPIRLGTEDFPEKLDRLEKILPDLASKSKEIEYVDLNYPTKAVVKMRIVEKTSSRKS